MFNKRVQSWMGILGIFGFAGILGFVLDEPSFIIFFTFFGFFGFYWEGKLNKEKVDERLKNNFYKAQRYGYRTGLLMSFLAVISSPNVTENCKTALMMQTTFISLSIAITLILIPLLTYQFDRGNLDDSE